MKRGSIASSVTVLIAAQTPLVTHVHAQAWPAKSVRLVVPAPPGSAPDYLSRILAVKLGEMWGHTAVIDNIVGASGHIGTERVLAMPDVRERFQTQAAEPSGNKPEEFAAFIRAETAKWAKVIKASGATAE